MSQPESTETVVQVCGYDVGDPPEVCRCLLLRGHSGLHSCKHTERPNVPSVDPARVARYAEAIVPHTSDGYDVDDDPTGCWCKERLDGHRWSDHLAEVVVAVADAELAELRAEVERLRGPFRCCPHCSEDVVHDVEPDAHDLPCQICEDTLRRRAEAAEAKVAAVEQAMERRSKLHARWNGVQELVVTVEDLQAALVGASPDAGGLHLSDEEFAGFQAAVRDEPAPEGRTLTDEIRYEAQRLCDEYRTSLPAHVSTEAVWDDFTGQAVVNLGLTPWGHCDEHEVHQSWCDPCRHARTEGGE